MRHFLALALLLLANSSYAATSCVQNTASGSYEASNTTDEHACPAELALFSGEQPTKPSPAPETVVAEVTEREVTPALTEPTPVHRPTHTPIAAAWHLKAEDGSVYAALKRWATSAGWQMSWEIPVDFPIEILDSSNGTFEDAVQRVLTAFRVADYPPYPCFHENKVVRVIRRIQGNGDECKQ